MIYYINNNIYVASDDSINYFLEESSKIRSSREVISVNSIEDIRNVEDNSNKCVLSFSDKALLNDILFSYVSNICSDLSVSETIKSEILSSIGVDSNASTVESFRYQLDDASSVSYEILLIASLSSENPKVDYLLKDKLMNSISKIERDAVEDQVFNNSKQIRILMDKNKGFKAVIDGCEGSDIKFSTLNRAIIGCAIDIESDPRLFSFEDFYVTSDLLKSLKDGGDYKALLPNAFNGLCNFFGKRSFRINSIVL